MLQRGQAGAPGTSMPQQPLQQQHQQQQPGSSSPADMFNNLATMYGLPSAQPNAAAGGGISNPAEAGAARLAGVHDMRACGSHESSNYVNAILHSFADWAAAAFHRPLYILLILHKNMLSFHL